MNVVLIMVRENGQRRSFALTRDCTVIGRREDADFRIPLTDVSRKHCRLLKKAGALVLEDLGSSNGTLHNGEKIKVCELEAGDTIRIGPIQFIVQIDGRPAEDDVGGPKAARSSSPTAGTGDKRAYAPPPPPPDFDSGTLQIVNDGRDGD